MKSTTITPCELLDRNPLPKGFIPGTGKRPAFDSLRPAEDARLLSCTLVPVECRLLYGVLAREGMRLSEALGLCWRHLDLQHGTVRLDVNKTGEPRVWALREDVARVLATLGKGKGSDERVFARTHDKAANRFRAWLKAAGVNRPELFERTPARRPIRVHDLRATFITIGLASGKSEAWICDRTGHKSSQMVNAYRRAARTAAELGLGELRQLDECIPELSSEPPGVPEVFQVNSAGGSDALQPRKTTLKNLVGRPGFEPGTYGLKGRSQDSDEHNNTDGTSQAGVSDDLSASIEPALAQVVRASDGAIECLIEVLERAVAARQWGEVRRIAGSLERLQAAAITGGNVVELSSYRTARGGL